VNNDGTDQEPKPAWSTASATVGVITIVLSGSAKGNAVRVGKGITIGSADENDLVLVDRMVSRRHCELARTTQGIRVVDLGSTNGMHVNGVRVAA
jgi:pSer/pThr/pTyr-binding forkhead associated (FHA) protein